MLQSGKDMKAIHTVEKPKFIYEGKYLTLDKPKVFFKSSPAFGAYWCNLIIGTSKTKTCTAKNNGGIFF